MRFLLLVGSVVGGWAGWWLGMHIGIFTALIVSSIGTGGGYYLARRYAQTLE